MADPYNNNSRPWQTARVIDSGAVGSRGPNASIVPPALQQPRFTQQEFMALQREIREQRAFMDKLKEEPRLCATVVEVREDSMMICFGPGNAVDVKLHEGAKVGDRVLVKRDTMQVLETVHDKIPSGTIVTVERVTGDMVEANLTGLLKAFKMPSGRTAKMGERVVLDPSMQFVIGTLGMPPAKHAIVPKTGVNWDDVGGQAEAKAAMREAIELPMKHPKLFAGYGKKPVKGVLLKGGPGLGKTLIAKAAATAIAKAHGHDSAEGFQYIKGPELLDSFIGKTEANIRAMMEATRVHMAKFGFPATVFIDECDALLGRRDRSLHTSIGATVVPMFLAEMDGLDAHSAFFILATNRADSLDTAVVRDGRIDITVSVSRPTPEDARAIFQIHLRGRPLAAGDETKKKAKKRSSDELAPIDLIDRVIAEIYSERRVIREIDGGRIKLRLRDFVSGAIIAGIVERASTIAMNRDIESNTLEPSGITEADLRIGIDLAEAKARHDDYTEILREIIESAEHVALKAANEEPIAAL